jgi:hypothetical protein
MKLGTIKLYDPNTMTAEIISADGMEQISDAGFLMTSFDPIKGGGSFTPPVAGSTCVYETVSGETLIFGAYAPINGDGGSTLNTVNDPVKSQNDLASISNTYISRAGASLPGKTTMPGASSTTTPGGLTTLIADKFASISITPIFYATMNAINEFFDVMATTLRFRSPAIDVNITADAKSGVGNPTQVNVIVRQSSSERADGVIPSINLVMGKDTGSGIIDLKINGHAFLKVDINRNAVLDFKTLTMKGEVVDATAVTTDFRLP